MDSNGEPVDRFSSVSVDRVSLLGNEALYQSLAKKCPMQYLEALNQALIV